MDKDVGADRALVSDHASYAVDGPAGFDHGEVGALLAALLSAKVLFQRRALEMHIRGQIVP